MIVAGFKPLTGVQCESTTCRNLLASEGHELSEPMIFGLGSGIGFTYMDRYDRRTGMREPVVLCTARPGEMAKNLGEVLGPKLIIEETVSRSQAWANLLRRLDCGKPYGLKLDRFYLNYIEKNSHFNAHYLTACGYDESSLYVVDVGSQEVRKPSLQSIERARSAKGFMASKNLGLYYEWRPPLNFEGALKSALTKTAAQMLYGGSTFSGVKGIERFAERVAGWWKNPNFGYQLLNHYVAWEGDGEARGGFRNLFACFLDEASAVLNNGELMVVAESFRAVANGWSEIDEALRQLCFKQDNVTSSLMNAAKAIKRQATAEAIAYRSIEKAVIP